MPAEGKDASGDTREPVEHLRLTLARRRSGFFIADSAPYGPPTSLVGSKIRVLYWWPEDSDGWLLPLSANGLSG